MIFSFVLGGSLLKNGEKHCFSLTKRHTTTDYIKISLYVGIYGIMYVNFFQEILRFLFHFQRI